MFLELVLVELVLVLFKKKMCGKECSAWADKQVQLNLFKFTNVVKFRFEMRQFALERCISFGEFYVNGTISVKRFLKFPLKYCIIKYKIFREELKGK